MEFKNTLELLITGMDEIKQLMQRIEKEEKIRSIDLDLALDKLRNVYDLMLEMKSLAPEEKGKQVSKEEPEFEIDQEFETEAEDAPEQKAKDDKELIEEEVRKEFVSEETGKVKPAEKNPVVSDRFKTSKPSINDEIAQKSKNRDLGSQLSSRPVTNLSSALGINDKFELINELFDGNKDAFEQTLQKLNLAGSFVEAYNYLEQNFDWNMDDPYVQRILELIRRKLIVRRDDS